MTNRARNFWFCDVCHDEFDTCPLFVAAEARIRELEAEVAKLQSALVRRGK